MAIARSLLDQISWKYSSSRAGSSAKWEKAAHGSGLLLDLVASHLYKEEKGLKIPLELKAAFYGASREQERTLNRRPIILNELKPLSVFKATCQDCTRV